VVSAVTQLKGGEENLASQPGLDTTSIYPGAPSTTTHNQLFLYAQSREMLILQISTIFSTES
jgi:hypothetical protein